LTSGPLPFTIGTDVVHFSRFDIEKYQPLYVPLAIFAGCLVIAIAIYASGGVTIGGQQAGDSSSVAGAQCGDLPDPKEITVATDDDPVLGDPNAPLTMISFSDASCGYCARFFLETFPKIKADYIDTGKLRFVFRDFTIHGETAILAAEAAHCANEQGKFWEYWKAIFSSAESLSADVLKSMAGGLGLDTGAFNSCLSSDKYRDEVVKDGQDGQNYGILGTPSFFLGKTGSLNGTLQWECSGEEQVSSFVSDTAAFIVGAYPYEDSGQYQGFKSQIEAALAK